jgi:hypothetical protein
MIYSLTGKYPIEIPSSQMTGELDWQSLIPNLSPNLRIILEKATKMDISNRYTTAQAMYQALHISEMQTIAVVPRVNKIDLSKTVTPNSPATVLIPNPTPNNPISIAEGRRQRAEGRRKRLDLKEFQCLIMS